MFVEIQTDAGQPAIRVPASQVVIYDDLGNPLAVAALYGPDKAIYTAHAKDKEFNRALATLGVRRTVVVDSVRTSPLPPGARIISEPR